MANIDTDQNEPSFAYAYTSGFGHRAKIVAGSSAMVAAAVFAVLVIVSDRQLGDGPREPVTTRTRVEQSSVPNASEPVVAARESVPPIVPADTKGMSHLNAAENPRPKQLATPEPAPTLTQVLHPPAPAADLKKPGANTTLVGRNIGTMTPPARTMATVVITYGNGKVTSKVEPAKNSGDRPATVPAKDPDVTRQRVVKDPRH